MSTDYIPPQTSFNGVSLTGQQPAPIPVPMPKIPASRTVVNPASPGAGRDAAIMRRSDPAEITGRIQNIFSNLGAALATDGETEQERLNRLTREVQAGRSFDDLRRSAGLIAAQSQRPVPLDELTPAPPAEYPTTPLPLSPEVQRVLGQRRLAADETLARAQEDARLQEAQARVAAGLRLSDVDRQVQQAELATRSQLAARGVARSPMFSNPAQRQIFEQANRASGEVRFTLRNTLSQLEQALREAESARQRELLDIEMEAVTARSDVNRLLGVN